MRCTTLGIALVLSLLLAGCGEPLEGDWQQVPPGGCTQRGQISVSADLEISGTVNLQDPNLLDCRLCNIQGTVEESDDDCYTGPLVLQNCPCNGDPNGVGSMCVQEDSEQLTFLIILQAACGDRPTVWEPL